MYMSMTSGLKSEEAVSPDDVVVIVPVTMPPDITCKVFDIPVGNPDSSLRGTSYVWLS